MSTFKITKNKKDLINGLSKQESLDKLFPTVEDFSNGYIYDNESETIYHEVDNRIVAVKGDESVRAGDDYFEIEAEND
jgi:hypothetical protein